MLNPGCLAKHALICLSSNVMMSWCVQAILKKAGKASALGSLEENDPDAADDDEEEADAEEEQAGKGNTVVDTLTDLLGKTGLTGK